MNTARNNLIAENFKHFCKTKHKNAVGVTP